jgi:hypothetical protein
MFVDILWGRNLERHSAAKVQQSSFACWMGPMIGLGDLCRNPAGKAIELPLAAICGIVVRNSVAVSRRPVAPL